MQLVQILTGDERTDPLYRSRDFLFFFSKIRKVDKTQGPVLSNSSLNLVNSELDPIGKSNLPQMDVSQESPDRDLGFRTILLIVGRRRR